MFGNGFFNLYIKVTYVIRVWCSLCVWPWDTFGDDNLVICINKEPIFSLPMRQWLGQLRWINLAQYWSTAVN